MSEEIQSQNEQKNTVATVGMWFSISWLVAIILIILWIICLINWFILWIFLLLIWGMLWLLTCWYLNLLVWFILWIVGLFYKPRGKARVAICIPLVIFVIIELLWFYVKKSIETPFNEFIIWANPQIAQLQDEENFDDDRFEDILQIELNTMINDIKNTTKDEWKSLFESSTGSNSLEKGAYILTSLAKQWLENALEKYNEWEIVEIDDDDNHIINVDIDVEEDEEIDEDEKDEDEITIEQPKKTNSETFTQSEKNDIEQILNILE